MAIFALLPCWLCSVCWIYSPCTEILYMKSIVSAASNLNCLSIQLWLALMSSTQVNPQPNLSCKVFLLWSNFKICLWNEFLKKNFEVNLENLYFMGLVVGSPWCACLGNICDDIKYLYIHIVHQSLWWHLPSGTYELRMTVCVFLCMCMVSGITYCPPR